MTPHSAPPATAPLRPEAAIDRVIYLLDRQLAPAQKVRAFQKARRIVTDLGDDALTSLIAAGGLYDLDGIGASTGSVISEAHAGLLPTYLAKLEIASEVPLGPGRPFREALRGDCHLHSNWSDGGAEISEMVTVARALGHEYIVLTDHSARLTVAHGLSRERLEDQFDEIARLQPLVEPFRILQGMEVDIFEDGSLDLDDDLLVRLDVVVASIHSKLALEPRLQTARMIQALSSPHTDILGHCTNRKVIGQGRSPSAFDGHAVMDAAARYDKAIEINCRPERQDPPEELLRLAVASNVKIAINTDAHAPGQLEWLNFGCDKAAQCGVPLDNIINTWPVSQLLDWANSHPTD